MRSLNGRRLLCRLGVSIALAGAALPLEARAQAAGKASTPPLEQLQTAVSAAERASDEDKTPLLEALDALAQGYERANRLRDSVGVLVRMVEIQEQWQGPTDPGLANTLTRLGDAYRQLGNYRDALTSDERALAIYRANPASDPRGEPAALGNLGYTYRLIGDYPRARSYYDESIAIDERVNAQPTPEFAIALSNMGALLRLMDKPEEALRYLDRATAMEERLNGPDHPNMAIRLSLTALTYEDLGEYGKELPLAQRALAISEKALGPEHRVIATRLHNLANAYLSLGSPEQALPLFLRAEAIDEKAYGPIHFNVALRLNGAALALRQMNRLPEAQTYAERALSVGEQALGPDNPDVAIWISNLAQVHRAKGESAEALVLYQRSIAILERALGPRHVRVAGGLNAMATAQWDVGDRAGSAASLQRALAILAGAQRPDTLWRVEASLQKAYDGLGNPDLSIYWGKQSVNTIQTLRGRLRGLSPELQKSFLTDKRAVYVALADHLIAAGRLTEAQAVLSMLKEEELYDYIARGGDESARDTRATFVGPTEVSAEQRWLEVTAHLAELGRESAELARKAKLGLSPEDEARRTQVDADLVLANQRFDRFMSDLSGEFAAGEARRAQEFGARQLRNLVVMQDVLNELGHGAVMLHYVVAENRVAIIVTTADVQIAREARIDATQLNRKVFEFREALAAQVDVTAQARALYGLLIAPVADDLRQAGAQNLMLSLDGTLRYLPFAALHDGHGWLAERYALSIYTEAARANLTRQPRKDWTMTGLGLTHAVPGFAALPAVREEFDGIRRDGMRGDVYLDDQFTADRMRDVLASAKPVMHIASHFQFRPGTYANSFLVLGDGQRLTLQEIRDRRMRFSNVDLLTLSACDTAMGGSTDETGAEVEGFGALAQQQGARAVLATLWPMEDGSTSKFMQLVYSRRRTDHGRSTAEALRQAQIAFMRDAGKRREKVDAKWAHPFYWSGYVLMGNYR